MYILHTCYMYHRPHHRVHITQCIDGIGNRVEVSKEVTETSTKSLQHNEIFSE